MKPQGEEPPKPGALDTPTRSLAKAVSWRAAGTVAIIKNDDNTNDNCHKALGQ
jgi:hypothetical protein